MALNQASDNLPAADQIEQLIGWVKEAGQIALSHFKKISPQLKPDKTFVTQADLQVEQFLTERLKRAWPDYGLIGEEGAHSDAKSESPYTWAIDPIDGTTVFVQGLPGWGISVGLLYNGQPCFGVFYMPLIDDITYVTHRGEVVNNGILLRDSVRKNWAEKPFLAISSSTHHDFQIDIKRTRALGSIGANLVYTARGTAAATFISTAHVWDLVAGAAILQRTGGELRYQSGRPIDYPALLDGKLIPEPIIAGHPAVLDSLATAIRPANDEC